MRVICRINNLNHISDLHILERLKKYISKPDGNVDLDLGREYKVYGMVFWDNSPWFYLCVEESDEYPRPFPSDFFDIIDSNLSPLWKLSYVSQGEYEAATSLVFDEWAKDPNFYERLIDGDSEAENIFAKYKYIMNEE